MKIRYPLVAAFAAVLAVPAAHAQASSATAARPEKIAVISLQEAIAGTAEGKQASQQLSAQFAPRRNELASISKQVQDIQQRLQAGQTTLSDDAKAELQRQGTELQRRGQREQQDLQEDMNDASQEAINRIGGKMMTVLDKYAKEHGYSVVIDTSAQNTPVVYASTGVNITQEIIKRYDATYPAKSAAPAAAHPGAGKPSQKPGQQK
ncbi:MAG TPA: OmpH family outer membrane protein [Candidatus Acidoferrales bacterium]|nr:OmpH family outer membrane protein [Candidatus Acidoferrales bacterium]